MPCLVKIGPVVLEKKLSTQLTTMMTTNNREILIRKALQPLAQGVKEHNIHGIQDHNRSTKYHWY